ncbi:hypothetical protein [Nocardiopsis potens]|uniref:hypothetical protein n=1 Tax=Nocardiopsis potens TaxID=1246458 RepID=UPI0003473198|nr:hypothetical protein [Nocardiopsis potens]
MSGPAAPARSEPTRLMCAGAYLDGRFRRKAIAELVECPERVAAPSLGFDAVPVLRHCLHARRLETEAGGWLVLVWSTWPVAALAAGGLFGMFAEDGEAGQAALQVLGLTLWFMLGFASLCLLAWARRFVSGRPTGVYLADRDDRRNREGRRAWPVLVFKAGTWAASAGIGTTMLGTLLLPLDEAGGAPKALALLLVNGAWPGLIALVVDRHRSRVDAVLLTALTQSAFTGAGPEVPPHYEPLLRRIGTEQYSSTVLYDPGDPFKGAGAPRRPWTLALELRPVSDEGARRLTGRRLVDVIRRRAEALTERVDEESRDRLTHLEVSEQVFLPGPLPYGSGRARLPIGPEDREPAKGHVADAVREGGEQRRHFLRLRVGGWEEEVVTTVYVRAHCQGRMLLLEVAPHVLPPITDRFRAVDALPGSAADRGPAARAGTALLLAPAASFMAGAALFRAAASGIRARLADRGPARAEPPRASLREIASGGRLSLFQEMDVERYTQTLHGRVGSAVRRSLVDAGYQADELQRHIVNIGAGGVFVGGSVTGGAIASGRGANAAHIGEESERG